MGLWVISVLGFMGLWVYGFGVLGFRVYDL
jgi:hypothetical protein